MLKFKEGNIAYSIVWRYDRDICSTTCNLFVNGAEKPLVSETVKCYHKDCFDKSIGRKQSLTKVVKTFTPDKNKRLRIWQTYFARKEKIDFK